MSLVVRVDTLSPIPTPYVFLPSSDFEGNDGSWSTFTINIDDDATGQIGQNFHILPSTSSGATYIPTYTENFCGNQTDADACYLSRGIQLFKSAQSRGFNTSSAQTWQQTGTYELAGLDSEVDYGKDDSALWGTANVGLGDASLTSQILPLQPVALLQNATYWMGLFGLSNVPTNINGRAYTTFIDNFWRSTASGTNMTRIIPSMSYAYYAGASYVNAKGQVGSLIFGGYDSSLFQRSRAVDISFPGGTGGGDSSLSAAVNSIAIYDDGTGQSSMLDSSTFGVTVDSTLPYLWLPDNICDQLETIYDVSVGPDGLYNVTLAHFQEHYNKTIQLTIANNVRSTVTTTISLPYQALYQTAKYPLVRSETRYLAFRRSPNNNFVLGRAFLQHAYLVVDYERRVWNIAPIVISDPQPSANITSIISTTIQTPEPSPAPKKGLGPGAIAGIVVGIVALALLLVGGFFYYRRSQNKKNAAEHPLPSEKNGYEHPGSPAPPYGSSINKNRNTYNTQHSTEMEDSSRSASAQGFYGHRNSESGSNITELVGSPPLGYNEKSGDNYFKYGAGVEPAPLAELPGDHGISEAPLRRPRGARKRSGGSAGSGGRVQSPDSERPDPIHEVEEAEHSPVLARRHNDIPEGMLAEPEEYHDEPKTSSKTSSKQSSEDARASSSEHQLEAADAIKPTEPTESKSSQDATKETKP